MSRTAHIRLIATYNEWMNAKIHEAARSLSDEALSENRNAFFGSINGTLNHLVAGDTVWLKRFAEHSANHLALEPIRQLPAPKSLDQLTFSNIREFSALGTIYATNITPDRAAGIGHYTWLTSTVPFATALPLKGAGFTPRCLTPRTPS